MIEYIVIAILWVQTGYLLLEDYNHRSDNKYRGEKQMAVIIYLFGPLILLYCILRPK